jgi:hypothetical protein
VPAPLKSAGPATRFLRRVSNPDVYKSMECLVCKEC